VVLSIGVRVKIPPRQSGIIKHSLPHKYPKNGKGKNNMTANVEYKWSYEPETNRIKLHDGNILQYSITRQFETGRFAIYRQIVNPYGDRTYPTLLGAVEYLEGVIWLLHAAAVFDRSGIEGVLQRAAHMVPLSEDREEPKELIWKHVEGRPGLVIRLVVPDMATFVITDEPELHQVVLNMENAAWSGSPEARFDSFYQATNFVEKYLMLGSQINSSQIQTLLNTKFYPPLKKAVEPNETPKTDAAQRGESLVWETSNIGEAYILADKGDLTIHVTDLPMKKLVCVRASHKTADRKLFPSAYFRSFREAVSFAEYMLFSVYGAGAVDGRPIEHLLDRPIYPDYLPEEQTKRVSAQTVEQLIGVRETDSLHWLMPEHVEKFYKGRPLEVRHHIDTNTAALISAFKSVLNKSVLHYYESDIKLSWECQMSSDVCNNRKEKHEWQLREEKP
jgi:hypothetical protein